MNEKWNDNNIQFTRLLAEIHATQNDLDLRALAVSMDLSVDEILQLFQRAEIAWEEIKKSL